MTSSDSVGGRAEHPRASNRAADGTSARETLPSSTVVRDEAAISARASAARRAAAFVPDETTLRILRSLARGASRSVTAEALNISESTVRRKLAQVRHGWGVESNTEVVVMAVRVGLI